jgi:hypothetical protein
LVEDWIEATMQRISDIPIQPLEKG